VTYAFTDGRKASASAADRARCPIGAEDDGVVAGRRTIRTTSAGFEGDRCANERVKDLIVAHRSRLSTILIDVPAGGAPVAAAFWSKALGVPATRVPGEEQFIALPGALPELVLSVQAVDDQARYHLDFETDDVDAETARLVALGAVEIGRWLECRTLRAPGGHLMCVIPCHSDPEVFKRLAHVWH
jgi:hypothetical protein